jgi:hypothetical protein
MLGFFIMFFVHVGFCTGAAIGTDVSHWLRTSVVPQHLLVHASCPACTHCLAQCKDYRHCSHALRQDVPFPVARIGCKQLSGGLPLACAVQLQAVLTGTHVPASFLCWSAAPPISGERWSFTGFISALRAFDVSKVMPELYSAQSAVRLCGSDVCHVKAQLRSLLAPHIDSSKAARSATATPAEQS